MTRDIAKSFGGALRAAREATGRTPQEAAELLYCDADFYRRLEAGKSLPSIVLACKAVERLGVDPAAALGAPSHVEITSTILAGLDDAQAQIVFWRWQYDDLAERLRVTAAQRDDLRAELADVRAQGAASIAALRQECEDLQAELGRVRAERDETLMMIALDAEVTL
jgi:transcriptional regulator with XRE-family HTH domain